MQENWISFDALDLIPKQNWPRVVRKRFFRINPNGQVQYLRTVRNLNWVTLRPVVVSGTKWFMAPLGFTHGNSVVIRIKLDELVQKYFKV